MNKNINANLLLCISLYTAPAKNRIDKINKRYGKYGNQGALKGLDKSGSVCLNLINAANPAA